MFISHFVLIPFAAAAPQDVRDAEAIRLRDDIQRLAERGAWAGVGRKYKSLVRLRGVNVSSKVHLIGAKAAQVLGNIGVAKRRAEWAVQAARGDESQLQEASTWLANLAINFGEVFVELSVAFKGVPKIEALDGVFDPTTRQVIAFADTALLRDRGFSGYLPLGRYRIGETNFYIVVCPPDRVFVRPVHSVEPAVEDVSHPESIEAPDRIVTFGARGAGWEANRWTDHTTAIRAALTPIDGILTIDFFQPEQGWLTVTPDPKKLEESALTPEAFAVSLQQSLNTNELIVAEDQFVFPPNSIGIDALSAATIGEDEAATPLVNIAAINLSQTGPYPVPPDKHKVAQYRMELKVRGDSNAIPAINTALGLVEGIEELGLRLEAQGVP